MQICFFGDSFTHGVGDPAGLGWRGRVVRRLTGVRPDVTAYDLGIRRNTSADILLRRESEARARLAPGQVHRLVFGFGSNDCADDGTGRGRVSRSDTLRNARSMLSRAVEVAPTLLIGPPPVLDDVAADRRMAGLEPELRGVAEEFGVPFLPVFHRLATEPAWTAGAAAGDGTHPDGNGYRFLADCVWNWPAFREWAGLFPVSAA